MKIYFFSKTTDKRYTHKVHFKVIFKTLKAIKSNLYALETTFSKQKFKMTLESRSRLLTFFFRYTNRQTFRQEKISISGFFTSEELVFESWQIIF